MKADRNRTKVERVSVYDAWFATNGLSTLNTDSDENHCSRAKYFEMVIHCF